MNITKVTTERIKPGAHGMVVAANVEGDGLLERAIPVVVRFGNVTARSVVSLGTAEGVRAVFTEMPQAGATLFIGYGDEPLVKTRFTFVPPRDPLVA